VHPHSCTSNSRTLLHVPVRHIYIISIHGAAAHQFILAVPLLETLKKEIKEINDYDYPCNPYVFTTFPAGTRHARLKSHSRLQHASHSIDKQTCLLTAWCWCWNAILIITIILNDHNFRLSVILLLRLLAYPLLPAKPLLCTISCLIFLALPTFSLANCRTRLRICACWAAVRPSMSSSSGSGVASRDGDGDGVRGMTRSCFNASVVCLASVYVLK
jgi:hypothetical protein